MDEEQDDDQPVEPTPPGQLLQPPLTLLGSSLAPEELVSSIKHALNGVEASVMEALETTNRKSAATIKRNFADIKVFRISSSSYFSLIFLVIGRPVEVVFAGNKIG